MPRIFLSHSSKDNRETQALLQWLAEQDPSLERDIFADLKGMQGGEEWQETLRLKLAGCESVLFLLSRNWQRSRECHYEYRSAKDLGRRIYCARLEPVGDRGEISAVQRRDLFVDGDGLTTSIDIQDGLAPVVFSTVGLERQLRDIQLPDLGPESFRWPPPDEDGRAPYRGWLPFESQDAAVFFGRDAELARAIETLREMREHNKEKLFVVLGASGTGKSAFLRAGILPRLNREPHRFTVLNVVRPGRGEALTGESGLVKAIFETRKRLGLTSPTRGAIKSEWVNDVDKVRELLIECQERATRLHGDPDDAPPTLVLPLDQAEELFSAEAGQEALALLALLRDLSVPESPSGRDQLRLLVAVTIRTDRYPVMQSATELAGIRRTVHDLSPMPSDRFREVIEGPAVRSTEGGHRLTLEPELVGRLLDDARANTQGGDTLPLLSLTLYRMFVDYGAGNTLTLAQYEQMGGIDFVVRSTVNGLLSRREDTRKDELERLRAAFVPWLATVNPRNDEAMRRIAFWTDLPESSRDLVEKFVDARLLVRDNRELSTQKGVKHDVVEVALESLLRQWDELAQWLRDEREDLKTADHLLQQAATWEANDRDAAYLFKGTLLAKAEALSATTAFGRKLEPTRDFVIASRQQETQAREAELAAEREKKEMLGRAARRLRLVLALTVVVALAAVAGLIGALVAQQAAKRSAKEAIAQKLIPEAQAMLADAREGTDIQAFQELLAANELAVGGDNGPVVDALVKRFSTVRIRLAPVPVIGVSTAENGHRVAVADADGNIQVWDTSSATWRDRPLDAPESIPTKLKITSIAISPDGTRIAAGTEKGLVQVWKTGDKSAAAQPISEHSARVTSVAFSGNGSRLASAGADGLIQLSDVNGGDSLSIPAGGTVFAVAFDPTSGRLASGGADGNIQLWNSGTGAPEGTISSAHPGGVMGVAFSPDGRTIASGGADRMVRLWNADSHTQIGPMTVPSGQGHTEAVTSVAFNSDGTRIVSSGVDLTVQLWDVARRQRIGDPMVGHEGVVWSAAFVPGGNEIVSAGNDHMIRVWNADIGQPISTPLTDRRGLVTSVAISGNRIASATVDGTVQLWSSDTGSLITVLPGHDAAVTSVAFSPAGDEIASGSTDGTIRLWRSDDGAPITTLRVGHPVFAVTVNRQGNRLASSSGDGQVTIWDVPSGRPLALQNKDNAVLLGLAFNPDGNRLASGGANGVLRMWSVDTGQQVWERSTVDALSATQRQVWASNRSGVVTSVAFSPNGDRIATGGAGWAAPDGFAIGIIQRWDANTGDSIDNPIQAGGVGSAVMSVAYSPHKPDMVGDRIASGSSDRTVRLWDADSPAGEQIGSSFTGHQDGVGSVAISPDGSRIVSGSADGTVRMWPNPPISAPPEALCAKLTQNLSEKNWKDWVSSSIPYETPCKDLPVSPDHPQ
jgi:WD40 repeat protein